MHDCVLHGPNQILLWLQTFCAVLPIASVTVLFTEDSPSGVVYAHAAGYKGQEDARVVN